MAGLARPQARPRALEKRGAMDQNAEPDQAEARMSTYLNAGGHGLPSQAQRARLLAHARLEAEAGVLAAIDAAQPELAELRGKAARLLGTAPRRVGLGHTTTQFWLAALTRMPLGGRRVLLSPHEWGTHVRFLRQVAPDRGLRLDVIPESEALDPAAWAARIGPDLGAILLPHVTSARGLVYPVARIAALPRPEQALVLVDAAQALGRVQVGLDELGADVVVSTGRKWLRGPRATAILALSDRAETVLGLEARALEPLDANLALRLGLNVALDEVLALGVPAHAAALARIALRFRAALAAHDRLAEWLDTGQGGEIAPGHVVLSVPLAEKPGIEARLQAAGILVKWPTPSVEEPLSQAARAQDRALLRITPHLYNDDAEAEALAAVLAG
ncbi:MAG: aminotransferase class V-fold PLP-dependent enzyme [Paracoccus sp. (in: a-proteobacteria)]|uniref:aminotransferase class V-fold PLP-dependent enzyme n=1 Tax=Paracoccus sp. TaxID=267 RepID=UPI0039E2747E